MGLISCEKFIQGTRKVSSVKSIVVESEREKKPLVSNQLKQRIVSERADGRTWVIVKVGE